MKTAHSLTACLVRWLSIAATCLAIAVASPDATADQPIQLRVLSYNIYHCAGVDRKLDVQRIAEVIRSVQSDIVALQEADQNVKRSQPVDQLVFLATHLDDRTDQREWLASVKVINDLIAKRGDAAAILAGDMNATPDSETLHLVSTVWKITKENLQFSIPVKQPTKQIDFILYAPPAQWWAVETRVLDEDVASDHRTIFSILQWQGTCTKLGPSVHR